MDNEPLLSVKNLNVSFSSEKKEIQVLYDISFDIKPNEILGVVGESGSGKSVTSLAVMGLLPKKQQKFLVEFSTVIMTYLILTIKNYVLYVVTKLP